MMGDPVTRGLPFEVGDLWQRPKFFDTFDKHDSILGAWESTSESLELKKEFELPDLDLALKIPALNGKKEELSPEAERVEERPESGILSPPDDDDKFEELDIWALDPDLDHEHDSPQLCTWEAFEGKDVPNSKSTACLSEAGPDAFDAALASLQDSIGVLPQDFTLRCLSALVLGRSSSLFSWTESESSFQQTLQGAAISGTSLKLSDSLVALALSIGNQIKRLRTFADATRSVRFACPALLALKSCTGELLDAIDESVSATVSKVQSLLQLQGLMERPRQLLALLTSLVESAKHSQTDEAVISQLSDRIYEEAQMGHAFGDVLQIVLARVSVPWLEALASSLGFADPLADCMDGGSSPATPQSEGYDSASFISMEDRSLLSETTSAVSLLRHIDPGHALLGRRHFQNIDRSPAAYFTDCMPDLHSIMEAAQRYENSIVTDLTEDTQERIQATTVSSLATSAENLLWLEDNSHEAYLADLDAIMSQQPSEHARDSGRRLHDEATLALVSEERKNQSGSNIKSGDLDISPVARLRPLIGTQHRLVNGVILRQLLREHRLRHHLEVQRSFQMFGNGTFVSRMCAALFSEDVQTAERKRGTVPTAEIVGLRLGASHDERWPPASSELQLSLMGILNDSAGSSTISEKLSFAIREMPEHEIDRVLDPHSIYALDFLKLQYNVTAPLDAVMTSNALSHYDEVFRFLLKLLRLVYAVGDLSKRLLKLPRQPTTACFAQEAQLFVSVLVSHIMDLGIAPPWQELMRSITTLERRLDEEDSKGEIGKRAHLGVEGLRQIHETCLDRIRSRLLMKRKHQKLQIAIESAFASLLKAAHAAGSSGFGPLTVKFHEAVKHLVDLLKETADKPPKSLAAAEAEDVEVLRTLLLRLNWNGHYEDQDQTW